ncbi:MAG: winged helix-turn-helix domain-containing protein [Gammaproteobacteria bacterium]|nr:winged helix-turn-helix domain-containing protein [Gammaproteobacteria bacterium]
MYTETYLNGHFNGDPCCTEDSEAQAHSQPRIEAVLALLSRKVGQTVSRRELLENVWGGDSGRDAALTATVCAIRRKLGDDCLQPSYIQTIRGEGYRLLAPLPKTGIAKVTTPVASSATHAGESEDNKPAQVRDRKPVSFLGDLMRRRVFRVLGLYLAMSWLVLQISEIIFDALGLPPWALTLVTLLVGLGLPIAAVLAWAFQITASGLVLDAGGRTANAGGTRLHQLVILSLLCALMAISYRLVEVEQRNSPAVTTESTQLQQDNAVTSGIKHP